MSKWILLFLIVFSIGAVNFDATDDQVDLGDVNGSELDQLDNDITVCIWAKSNTNTASENTMARKNTIQYGLIQLNNDEFRWEINEPPCCPSAITSGLDIEVGRWYHVCGWYNGSSLKIYVDGVELDDTARTGNMIHFGSVDTYSIGFFDDQGTPKAYWDGDLQEHCVWDGALSVREIQYLASSRGTRACLKLGRSDLAAYHPLDECATGKSCDGVTFRDLSGNALDGTGDNGANNTGLVGSTGTLNYP